MAIIGRRAVRSASSAALGGGRAARARTDTASNGMKTSPVAAGIQKALTLNCSIKALPMDFTTPDDRMKLAQRIAPRTSPVRRPSMKPNTRPQISPSGRPFRNSAATFQGAGTTANSTRASQEAPISSRIAAARRSGRISEITLTPASLDRA
ncbi:hypothetical protein D3C73_1262580 [compost metagenome]